MKTLAISHTISPPGYKPVPEGMNSRRWVYTILWQAWLAERKRLRETRPEVLERLEAIRAIERLRRNKEAQEAQTYWDIVKQETGCTQYGS